MAAQYELLKELLNGGTKLSFGQEFFFKFYQAFILKDRWLQYVSGVGTTLLVTALALALGIVLGSVVSLSSTISYLGAVKGKKLIAEAECVKEGRSTIYYRVNVTDDLGNRIAEVGINGFHVHSQA